MAPKVRCRLFMLWAVYVLPHISPAQTGGVLVGWVHASGNQIAYSATPETADFLEPGVFIGGYYTARDSGTCFKFEAGWEHQAWQQHFDDGHDITYTVTTREGIMTARLELIRLAPMVAFALGKRTRLLIGPEIGIIAHARTTILGTTTQLYDPPNPHGGGVYTTALDTTYTGWGNLSALQGAGRVGIEQNIGKWMVASAISIGGTFYRPVGTTLPMDRWPVTFRITVGRQLSQKQGKARSAPNLGRHK